MISTQGNLTSLKTPPVFPKNYDPKVVKVWLPKFDEFESLRNAWVDEWNKLYGHRQ